MADRQPLNPLVTQSMAAQEPSDMQAYLYGPNGLAHVAAVRLAPCSFEINCGNPNTNDQYTINRAPGGPNCIGRCAWWLPIGTIWTGYKAFNVYFHLNQFKDLSKPVSIFVPASLVGPRARASIVEAWERAVGWYERSVAALLVERDGKVVSKPAVEGSRPVSRVSLSACVEWCNGCKNNPSWPEGVPYCVRGIQIENENFDWGLYVAEAGPGYLVTLKRLPKTTEQRINDAIEYVTGPLDRAINWMCQTYASPAGQIGASAGMESSDPATKASATALNLILREGCAGSASPGAVTAWAPGSTVPGNESGATAPLRPKPNVAAEASIRPDLAPLPTKRLFDPKMIVGLVALGLATAGVVAFLRRRR